MNHLTLKTIALTLLVTGLSACGGSSSSGSVATSGTPSTPGLSCSGAVKDLFVAIKGTYTGTVDTAFTAGAGNPLTTGVTYPVTISADDCSIRFTGNKEAKYAFAFNNPANISPSNFVGFSASAIISNPDKLDLSGTQYNIGIKTATNTIELERRIAKNANDATVVDGDLHLFSVPDSNSFGGLHLKVSSRH
ncbi:hypothetical protein [Undibacterium flavidum]|uniref:Lipoprotein n=1 Tax=Undibacterium flavidum TaxID=2762297 RepID=A0ABR6YAI6_9BURK|nr:hypothetical protein [Undibacterium flavidum]MBC3873663.1 hypothetical protein [Undibacterium flavidum]